VVGSQQCFSCVMSVMDCLKERQPVGIVGSGIRVLVGREPAPNIIDQRGNSRLYCGGQRKE
jgi:hypothetical protein